MADSQFCSFSGVTILSADASNFVHGANGMHACNATILFAVYRYGFVQINHSASSCCLFAAAVLWLCFVCHPWVDGQYYTGLVFDYYYTQHHTMHTYYPAQ